MHIFLRVPLPPFLIMSWQKEHLWQSFFLQFSHSLQEIVRLDFLNLRLLRDPLVGRAEKKHFSNKMLLGYNRITQLRKGDAIKVI